MSNNVDIERFHCQPYSYSLRLYVKYVLAFNDITMIVCLANNNYRHICVREQVLTGKLDTKNTIKSSTIRVYILLMRSSSGCLINLCSRNMQQPFNNVLMLQYHHHHYTIYFQAKILITK